MSLIKTIDQLRPYIPVAYASKIEIMPSFDEAENDFLVPVLGNELYQALSDALTVNILSAQLTALLARCRAVIAPFAFVSNLPFIQTLLTNNGLIALEAENTRKAFKWEYNKAVAAMERNGYAAQEALILFLQAHKADYPQWASSAYHSNKTCGLITSGADLTGLPLLQQPHRTYMLIKPLIDTVVMMHLHKQIGKEFYQAFNARLIAGNATSTDKELVELLRPVLVRRTLEYAAVELSMSFNGSAFTVLDGTNSRDTNEEGHKTASDQALQRFREQMQQTATFFLAEAIDYLNKTASATVFPEYFASPLYPITQERVDRNAGRRGIFTAN